MRCPTLSEGLCFDFWRVVGVLSCCWAFANDCVLFDNCLYCLVSPPIILTVYEYMGSFYVNNINRKKKRWFSSPSSGKHFRVREMFLVSILSVWGENNPIKVSLWLALWRTVLYFLFFSFPFYLFVAFFHAVIFALVQPAMEGVEVRIPVETQEGVLSYLVLLWLVVLWWTECVVPWSAVSRIVCLWQSRISTIAVNCPDATHVSY